MASHKDKAWTYRVENIPYGTTVEQLINQHFAEEDQNHLSVKSIFPSVDAIEGEEGNFDLTATVLFKPPTSRPEGLRVPPSSDITVSKQFQGFTPLYVPPAGTKIDADVISITGLAGHAYGSWAWSEEKMWLRDELKKDIKNARILTYGYDSEVKNSTSFGIIKDHADNFLQDLLSMRDYGKARYLPLANNHCDNRPIIFIGHSLGCLIIKKVMIEAWDKGIHGARLPVRAIIFLAAPHRGLDVEALKTLVKQTPSKQLVSELERNSPTLRELTAKFHPFGNEIDILTCYEMKQTQTVMETEDGSWARKGKYVTMVDQESATLSYRREKTKGVAEDHSKIAKIRRTQGGIYPNIRSAIQRALRPTATVADEHQTSSLRAQELTDGQAAAPWASPFVHREPYSEAHPSQQSEVTLPSMSGEAGGLRMIEMPHRPTTPSQSWPQYLAEIPTHITHRLSTASLARSLSDGTLVPLEPPHDFLACSYSRSATPQPPQPLTRSRSQPEPLPLLTSDLELNLDIKVEPVSELDVESNPGAESETEPEMKVVMHSEESAVTITEPEAQPIGNLEPFQDSRLYPEDPEAISGPDSRPGSDALDREPAREPSPDLKRPERELDSGTEAEQENIEEAAVSRGSSSEAALPETVETAHPIENSSPPDCERAKDDTKEDIEVAVAQDSPIVICAKCSLVIPDPEPHYLYHPLDKDYSRCCESCDGERHSADKSSWCCHDCAFEAQFKCPMHKCKMEPMIIITGPYSKRTIPHISNLVSAADNSILAAIKQNDTVLLQMLVENRRLLRSHTTTDETPLHVAAQLGREDCTRILLSAEPDIKEQPRDDHGKTPLMTAVEYENLGVVKAILEYGIDVDAVNKSGSALSRAVIYGLADFVDELITHNATIENPDYNDSPLLYVAALNGDERTIGTLLSISGIDIDAKEASDGNSPLLIASAKGHERIVQMLLNKKADVHAVNKKGETALHLACFHGNMEAARILLVAGADSHLKLQDSDGNTPLHMASSCDSLGNLKIARDLVSCYNADLEIKNRIGRTPLFFAVEGNRLKIVDVLLEAGADVNTTDNDGKNLLHLACAKGHLEVCRALISRKANLEAKDEDERNPLHLAVRNNHLDIVKFLLDCDQAPYVDEVMENDFTSLHYAALEGYSEICTVLLDHQASMTLITQYWDTPAMLAAREGQIDCLKVFVKHNADLNYDCDGYNIMWSAAKYGHVETVKFLLENGASGFPPSCLHGKWKRLKFSDNVDNATRGVVLVILRDAKYK